jgi:CTP:molybdopterin cytidylyltransferase MocA
MKVVAALMVAAIVLAAGTSFAFGDCPGHTKAQMVKSQPQVQMSQDQPASTPITVAEKAEPAKPAAQMPERK